MRPFRANRPIGSSRSSTIAGHVDRALFLFRTPGWIAWVGTVVVVENVVSSLAHSHLFDFMHGWLYVLWRHGVAAISAAPDAATDEDYLPVADYSNESNLTQPRPRPQGSLSAVAAVKKKLVGGSVNWSLSNVNVEPIHVWLE